MFASLTSVEQYGVPFEFTRKYVPAGSRVLDWGCGTCHYSFVLRQLGHRVNAYSLWREEGFTRMLETDGEFELRVGHTGEPVAIPYEDDTFDAVFSIGVLEHVRETQGDELASLLEIKRVLKPGGYFICAHFPNKRSWIEWLARKRRASFYHQYRYRRSDIARLCREARMRLIEVKLYNVLPRRIMNRLPGKNSSILASVYRWLDSAIGLVAWPFAQNWAFIARKD